MNNAPNITIQELRVESQMVIITLYDVRCPCCGKLICRASGIVQTKCTRCKNEFTKDTNESLEPQVV